MVVITRGSAIQILLASATTNISIDEDTKVKNEYSRYSTASKFVRKEVKRIIEKKDPTLSGPILRLAFHDATVRSKSDNPWIGGADGSIRYELDWSENRGLSKPLKVIEEIYELQNSIFQDNEYALSFADTLALSGAASVEAAKGPKIPIKLGRRDVDAADSRFLDKAIESESDRSALTTSLPSAALDSLGLRNYFGRLGLSESEFVALSGAHDLGRHVTLTDMPKSCLKNLTRDCLENAPVLAPFITKNPDTFSNTYFEILLRWNKRELERGEAAFIPTDVAMVVDDGLKQYVEQFASDEIIFFREFKNAYQKMVETTATTVWRY